MVRQQQNQMKDFIWLSLKYTFALGLFFALVVFILNPLPLAWRELIITWLPVDLGDRSILEYLSQYPLTFLLLTSLSFVAIIMVKTVRD